MCVCGSVCLSVRPTVTACRNAALVSVAKVMRCIHDCDELTLCLHVQLIKSGKLSWFGHVEHKDVGHECDRLFYN